MPDRHERSNRALHIELSTLARRERDLPELVRQIRAWARDEYGPTTPIEGKLRAALKFGVSYQTAKGVLEGTHPMCAVRVVA
jgi:hypothetical protein